MKFSKTIFFLVLTVLVFSGTQASSFNYSLRFDGADDYVSVDDPVYFGESYTIECWFKVEISSKDKCILTTYTLNEDGNYIYIDVQENSGSSAGKVRYLHRVPATKSSNDGWNIYSTQRYDDNKWHHLAAVYDNNYSGSQAKMYLYIDGNLESSRVVAQKPINDDSYMYLGKNATWDNRWFERYLDELRIWNTARSQTQIQDYLCQELDGTEPNYSDLNLYFQFNEGTGIITTDLIVPQTASLNTNNAPNWWYAGFAPECYIYKGNMALWYDPHTLSSMSDGDLVSFWEDRTTIKEDATMGDVNRQPKYKTQGIVVSTSPSVKKPGVDFTLDYGQTNYGLSDIMTSPFNGEITSTQPNKWTPTMTDKSLFVLFQTGEDLDYNGSQPDPYYSDGRQCVFEAGGPLSGFNIYITQGKLVFGMWNRFESKYIKAEGGNDLYPLVKNKVYIALLEYKNGKFRAVLGGYKRTGTDPATGTFETMVSQSVDFQGLSKDDADLSAVGGASRTSYHDYNTGETYSDHFGGVLGDVILYNGLYSVGDPQNVISYLIHKYDLINTTVYPLFTKSSGEWTVYDQTRYDLSEAQLSDAWPNPFATTTSFSLNIPEAQNVTIEVFDNMGNKVLDIYEGSLGKGIYDFTIDGTGLANGMYIFRATGDGFVKSGKVVLSK